MWMTIRRVAGRAYRLINPPPSTDLSKRYPQYLVGAGTYGDLTVRSWNENTTLEIGSYTSIAAGVKVFLGGEHRIDWVTTYPFSVLQPSSVKITGHPHSKGNVKIGSDVWIGAEAVILSGVTIGDGAVIGARAVVAKDVPPYGIVVGNPARFIRFRFDHDTVETLLRVRWWEWPPHKITAAVPDLLSKDIATFIKKAERGDYA